MTADIGLLTTIILEGIAAVPGGFPTGAVVGQQLDAGWVG